MSDDTAATPVASLEPTPAPRSDPRIDAIAAIIRNGLSNGPIAQSQAAWDCLQTRLGEIARAILEEI